MPPNPQQQQQQHHQFLPQSVILVRCRRLSHVEFNVVLSTRHTNWHGSWYKSISAIFWHCPYVLIILTVLCGTEKKW